MYTWDVISSLAICPDGVMGNPVNSRNEASAFSCVFAHVRDNVFELLY